MHTAKLRSLDKLLLALIFLTLSASTIAWTLANRTPPAWDPSDHMLIAYDYYVPIAHLDWTAFREEFFIAPHYYAPLVHLVTAGVFLVLGASRLTGIIVNLVSLAVLLMSVSWIGRRLYLQQDEAQVAARGESLALAVVAPLLATSYHFSAWLLHDAFLDYPLTAIVALSFALLISAGDFKERRSALIFGISAGLGMLTKQTFAFFLVLPALYITLRVLLSRDLKALVNLVLAGVTAAALASIWYWPHLHDVIQIYQVNKQAAVSENEAPLFTFFSNLFYPHALLSTQMQLPLGLLFLAGLIYSLARRRTESVILYLWLLGGIASFTLVANKDARYTLPMLPAAALISVCWLSGWRTQRSVKQEESSGRMGGALKPALVACIAVWALVSFFNAQWPRSGMGYYLDTPNFRWMVFGRNYFALDHRPLPDEWGVPDIVRTIASQSSPQTQAPDSGSGGDLKPSKLRGVLKDINAPTVGVAVNLPYLNPSTIALYTRLLAAGHASPPLFNVDWLVVEGARDRIEKCDFLVVRTGLDRAEWVAPLELPLENLIRTNPERFIEIGRFPIPIEGAQVLVYKCRE